MGSNTKVFVFKSTFLKVFVFKYFQFFSQVFVFKYIAKVFAFSNTLKNTLYFSYKNCYNYNQYILDIYIHIYLDRQRKNERLTGYKGYEW